MQKKFGKKNIFLNFSLPSLFALGGDLNADFDINKNKYSVKEFLKLLRQNNCYCEISHRK